MKLVKFLFPFLFVRNWHSGEEELSRPRVVAFGAAVGFLVLGLIAVAILQMPVAYVQTS